jgi:hypothetical protein
MKHSEFRTMMLEFLIKEENPITKKEIKNTSLDIQVDKLFTAYEKEAKNLKMEGTDFRLLMRRMLTEAGEDEDKTDDETNDEDTQPKLTLEDINVESFAESVVRLINNYDSLLEIRNTIIERSRNFLEKNYQNDVLTNYNSVLEDEFGINTQMSSLDQEYDIKVPAADRAGQSPGA